MLGRKLGGQVSIHVVDTTESLSPGHAEATLPTVFELLRFFGVEANEFVEKSQGTYSLGRRLADFGAIGETFWHGHGALGVLVERRPFYHFWHKARAEGLKLRLEPFSQEISLALVNRFIFPTNSLGIAQNIRYGLHLDGAIFALMMRSIAERSGVVRLERKLVGATRAEDGRIAELKLDDGGALAADLYIDCTGARAQLIGETLGVGYQDWSNLLPCDRQISAPVMLTDLRPPYVRQDARAAGWQWRMPLQTAMSVGQVYASAYQGDDEARQEFLASAGDPLADPVVRAFRQGRREVAWRHNVVAVGAAAGELEPLAGAGLHLETDAIFTLLDHFPDARFSPANIASYNALVADAQESARDFTLLHYCLTRRDDSPFWRHFSSVELPPNVAERIAAYRATGRIVPRKPELFADTDWFWILEGMGVTPEDYDPLVDLVDFEQVKRVMLALGQKYSADASAAPTHDSFFAQANARLASIRKAAPAAPSAPAAPPAPTPSAT